MTRLVAAELLKLRTTRTFFGITGAGIGLVALISVLATAAGDWQADDRPGIDMLGVASLVQAFALVLGILAVTTEFRHGTITPSLLVIPSRVRLAVAKLGATAIAAVALGIAGTVVCLLAVALILPARDIASGLTGSQGFEIGVGNVLGTLLYGVIGVGIGALVRNQVGAIIGALGWLFLIEPLAAIVPGVGDTIEKLGPGGAAAALLSAEQEGGGNRLDQVPGGLLLTAYAVGFFLVGVAMLRRRDVTA